jgi:hypothetical protein
MTVLEPNRDQLEIFVDAALRYRGTEGFISLRSFYEDDESKRPARVSWVSLKGNFEYLIDCAIDDARRAAQCPKPVVFCPPLCVFGDKNHAREQDVLAGLLLSVECDRAPHAARRQLEDLLGPATIVVRSGGQWIDDGGAAHDRLHLHWRLASPARTPDERVALKGARASAARLVGGDGTNNPLCHPIRWPGSWHRKKEPRLSTIVAIEPDVEISLAAGIAALPVPPAMARQGRTVEDWLSFLDDTYEDSERGGALARYAGLLIRTYLDPVIIESSVRLFNAQRCNPPLDFDEVRRIVESIARRHTDQLNQERRP